MAQLVKAKFEFWAENDAELSFRVGDVITVISRDDEGWWEGELNGQRGLFPANYCEIIQDSTAPPQTTAARPPPIPTHSGVPQQQIYKSPPPPHTNIGVNASPNPNYSPSNPPVRNTPLLTTPLSSSATDINRTRRQTTTLKTPPNSTKFGLWASNMAWYAAFCMIVDGGGAILWNSQDSDKFNNSYVIFGAYTFVVGLLILPYEYFFGVNRTASKFPARAICYFCLAIPCFLCNLTILMAIFLITIAVINILATINSEAYEKPPEKEKKNNIYIQSDNFCDGLIQYLSIIRQQNKIGSFVFMFLYFTGNVVLFGFTVSQITNQITNAAITATGKVSLWVAYAKGFGMVLDLNCALILLPVCRSMLRMLYNRSTADQGLIARSLRGILYFIPVDHNLLFHRIVAKVVLWAAVGHTIAHVVNYALAPGPTFRTYNIWPFLSGAFICYTMLILYSSALENTKRGHFELFWYTHHVFVVFFVLLIVHGRGGLGPHFWMYFIGPGALYFIERCLRVWRARKKVVVLSVTLMDDVFSLELAKDGIFSQPYKEGQYVFIKSPAISPIQWHPFTISSAPQEKTVTVHIRVMAEGSWTRGLRDYVAAMGARGKPFFMLDRQGPQGKLMGKILGPDGRPMLELDGPYSAPTQHIGEYSVALVVGAGIGVTPVSAAVKSVVFHRWKYFIGQCFPDHAYFAVVCAYKDIDAFRWLIRIIKDAQDEVIHMRTNNPTNMASKTFEMHIWITSVPKVPEPVELLVDDEIGFWGVPREDAKVEKVRANWDEADLYKCMKAPAPHTQMGDVHVYNGRPNWDPLFAKISQKHAANKVGVAFCGNPSIAKDLGTMCYKMNNGRDSNRFVLHKENF